MNRFNLIVLVNLLIFSSVVVSTAKETTFPRLSKKWIEKFRNEVKKSKPAPMIDELVFTTPAGPFSLFKYLGTTKDLRNQSQCGSCWAWATLGALEILYNRESNLTNDNAVKLAVQYFNDIFFKVVTKKQHIETCKNSPFGKICEKDPNPKSQACQALRDCEKSPFKNVSICNGGGTEEVVETLNKQLSSSGQIKFPLLSNDNYCSRYYTVDICNYFSNNPKLEKNLPCDNLDDKGTVGENKNAVFGKIPDTISFSSIEQMKYYIASGVPLTYSLVYLKGEDFDFFWNNQPVDDIFKVGPLFFGHLILIIGYYDDPNDKSNSYFEIANSWGTTAGRPKGTFRAQMYPPGGDKLWLDNVLAIPNMTIERPIETTKGKVATSKCVNPLKEYIPFNESGIQEHYSYKERVYFEDMCYIVSSKTGSSNVYISPSSSPKFCEWTCVEPVPVKLLVEGDECVAGLPYVSPGWIKSIKLEGGTISPRFSPTAYNYTISYSGETHSLEPTIKDAALLTVQYQIDDNKPVTIKPGTKIELNSSNEHLEIIVMYNIHPVSLEEYSFVLEKLWVNRNWCGKYSLFFPLIPCFTSSYAKIVRCPFLYP